MKYIFTLILSITAVTIFAQPAYTSMVVPAYDTYTLARSKFVDKIDTSSSGEHLWDFSNHSFKEITPETTYFHNPTSTAYSAHFPEATLAMNGGGTDYSYFKSTTTESTELGALDGGGALRIYTNPNTLLRLPILYNSPAQVDSFGGVFRNGFEIINGIT